MAQIFTGEIPFPAARDARVIKDVLQGLRPPRQSETTALRGLSDHAWTCMCRWWAPDPLQRGVGEPRINLLSEAPYVCELGVPSAACYGIRRSMDAADLGRLDKMTVVKSDVTVSDNPADPGRLSKTLVTESNMTSSLSKTPVTESDVAVSENPTDLGRVSKTSVTESDVTASKDSADPIRLDEISVMKSDVEVSDNIKNTHLQAKVVYQCGLSVFAPSPTDE
jgi:hypothetical protein